MMIKSMIFAALLMTAAATAWAQVPADDFEQWDSVGGRDVHPGWWGGSFGSGKTEPAHGGRYAATVWNWYYYGKGYLITGRENTSFLSLEDAGLPIDFKATALTGYYRYDTAKNSRPGAAALAYVMLKRYDPLTGRRDTIGYAEHRFAPAAEYRPFAIQIPDRVPGTGPDSIVIAFVSSDSGFCGPESDGNCCYLSVDDLRLTASSGVSYDAAPLFETARLYPAPLRSTGRIEWPSKPGRIYTLRIYSIAGELLRTVENLAGGSAPIERNGLPAGAYLFELLDGAGVAARGRFVAE